jgi:hypothetical protein
LLPPSTWYRRRVGTETMTNFPDINQVNGVILPIWFSSFFFPKYKRLSLSPPHEGNTQAIFSLVSSWRISRQVEADSIFFPSMSSSIPERNNPPPFPLVALSTCRPITCSHLVLSSSYPHPIHPPQLESLFEPPWNKRVTTITRVEEE